MTKVSIIIPVYNLEKYLERCLQSVLNQSLKDIEVLCINDASTDNSLLILEKYRNQDKRIKVHTINKSGQGVARNTGIKMATGEYIGFVDGDDAIEPNMYEELYNTAINNNSEITFCHTNCFYNDKKIKLYNYEKEKKKFWHTNTNIHFSHSEIIPFLSYVTVVCWNKIYKKTLLDSTDALFEPYTYDEDIPFFFITMLNANKITVIRKALYRHYVGRSDSSSNTYSGNVARIANIFNTTEKKIKSKLSDNKIAAQFFLSKTQGLLSSLMSAYLTNNYSNFIKKRYFIIVHNELENININYLKLLNMDQLIQIWFIKKKKVKFFKLRSFYEIQKNQLKSIL